MSNTDKNLNQIVLPALRGCMGDWVYYSCLMKMREIEARIIFPSEIRKSEVLSEKLQRALEGKRAGIIADYIQSNKQRFFNSMIVATYAGDPEWIPISSVEENTVEAPVLDKINQNMDTIGFLKLNGKEKLFTIDGQHRLAGIKEVFKTEKESQHKIEIDDDVSVIFISHKDTEEGRIRTRRLFTVLNKMARPVAKSDIIYLDEDDEAAITTRWLIENSEYFSAKNLALVEKNNLPSKDVTSLTTIGNLYDILKILFKGNKELKKIGQNPTEKELNKYFQHAKEFFKLLKIHFNEISEFFEEENNTEVVVHKYRGGENDSILFRPIGLEIFTGLVVELQKKYSLMHAIELASKLPRNLSGAPYMGLIWKPSQKDPRSGNMVGKRSYIRTVRKVLMFMLDEMTDKNSDLLEERYSQELKSELGDGYNSSLPDKVRIIRKSN